MLKETLSIKKEKCILLTVEFNGTIEEYAMAWLKLTNYAREYSNMIWKIQNTPKNHVYVYCNPKSAEAVKSFCTGIVSFYHEEENKLHQVGEVIAEDIITVGIPIYDYKSTANYPSEEWEKDINNVINDWMPVDYD